MLCIHIPSVKMSKYDESKQMQNTPINLYHLECYKHFGLTPSLDQKLTIQAQPRGELMGLLVHAQ